MKFARIISDSYTSKNGKRGTIGPIRNDSQLPEFRPYHLYHLLPRCYSLPLVRSFFNTFPSLPHEIDFLFMTVSIFLLPRKHLKSIDIFFYMVNYFLCIDFHLWYFFSVFFCTEIKSFPSLINVTKSAARSGGASDWSADFWGCYLAPCRQWLQYTQTPS